jgi:hypothetical protein
MIRNATAYEDDFYAWTQEQARLLQSGQVSNAAKCAAVSFNCCCIC